MGKNHRHKKNLKADKAKVKLKQSKTKFLPKGLNETKATFKIKPIVLTEQLKEKNANALLSKRKLNIKELCTRLNHYNENVRTAACEELTEMYKHYHEEIITESLGQVILNISNLMQDRECKVRKAIVKALNVILELTPGEKLEPFFKYFSVNLRCAMSHIDQNIQEDSLKFLDCFLVKDCGLISKTSDKLLPDFLTLISRLKNGNNLGRTLTINLGSKMTSVTWRVKVLSRLNAILGLILKKRQAKEERNVNYYAEKTNTIPMYKNNFFKTLSNPVFDDFDSTSNNLLNSNIESLIPMFYDIWMEVIPDKKHSKASNESTYLNEEASAILWCIINTVYLLWKYLQTIESNELQFIIKVFISVKAANFFNHLIANFPYCQTESNIKNKNKQSLKFKSLHFDVSDDPNCVKENILICYLCFVLNANFSRNAVKKELESIASFINKCLLTKNYIDQENAQYLIEFLQLCLVENCHIWKKSKVDAKDILNNVIYFYNNMSIGERNKTRIFKILSGLIDNPYLSKCPKYSLWLSNLPELLLKPQISESTVEILSELARKNCTPFLNGVKSKLEKILENLGPINILPMGKQIKNVMVVKREIAFIFYYMNDLTCNELKNMLQVLSGYISEEDCFILKEKLHRCQSDCLIV